MSLRFTILGWNGKPHSGRGQLVRTEPHGTHIVRLTSDDLGGFGTYRRGAEVRISPHEIDK